MKSADQQGITRWTADKRQKSIRDFSYNVIDNWQSA